MDTPGEGEKPPAAPKPGQPGSNDVTGATDAPPLAQPKAPTAKPAADQGAEVGKFLQFAQKRQKAGTWRDFESAVLPAETLAALNTAAKAGASADELRALVGLGDQPEAFRRRVADTERAYRAYTSRLATAVAERIEREA
jgi:hypothetical protein